MDYEELARGQLRELIAAAPQPPTARGLFSQGEMRMTGCLQCGHDGVTAGELAELLGITTARVAATLKSLEKKNVVCRARDPKDRRRVLVYLTAHGRALAQRRMDENVLLLAEVYRRMGETDTREFLRLQRRVEEIAEALRTERGEAEA